MLLGTLGVSSELVSGVVIFSSSHGNFFTVSSACRSIDGHHTFARSLLFITVWPGWPSCASLSVRSRNDSGVTILFPRSRTGPTIVSSFRNGKNGLFFVGSHVSFFTFSTVAASIISSWLALIISDTLIAFGVAFSTTVLTWISPSSSYEFESVKRHNRETASAVRFSGFILGFKFECLKT